MTDHTDLRVDDAGAGERLDRFVASALRARGFDVSNRQGKSLVESGSVRVDGQCVHRASLRMQPEMHVVVDTSKLSLVDVEELVDLSAAVIHRDQFVLAINKPSGLPTHATHEPDRDHAQAAVERILGEGAYVAVHHRLDVDTSGVLLFAIDRAANKGLADAFAERATRKEYLAIVIGDELPADFDVENNIGRDRHSNRMIEVHSGDHAKTQFETLARSATAALVRARPVTGRTHQIRVHLAGRGAPVVGDDRYGGVAAPRLLLHAERLVLDHPVTAERLELFAPAPDEFVATARTYGLEVP